MNEAWEGLVNLRDKVLAGEDVPAHEYQEVLDAITGPREIKLTLRERLEGHMLDLRCWIDYKEEKMIKWITLSTIILWLLYLADLLSKG